MQQKNKYLAMDGELFLKKWSQNILISLLLEVCALQIYLYNNDNTMLKPQLSKSNVLKP